LQLARSPRQCSTQAPSSVAAILTTSLSREDYTSSNLVSHDRLGDTSSRFARPMVRLSHAVVFSKHAKGAGRGRISVSNHVSANICPLQELRLAVASTPKVGCSDWDMVRCPFTPNIPSTIVRELLEPAMDVDGTRD
jgi:hypothetical protein